MEGASPRDRLLRPEEWTSLFALAAAVVLCHVADKPFDFTPDSYYSFFVPAIVLFISLSLAIVFLGNYRRRKISSVLFLTGFLRDWWTLPLCFAIYSNIKVLMPLLSTRLYDSFFLASERLLFSPFLGQNQYPTKWLLQHAGPLSTWLMDKAYLSYFYFYPVSFSLAYFGGRRVEFRRLLLGVLLIYYIGAFLYLLVPVVGPVYFVTECPEIHEMVRLRATEAGGRITVPLLQDYLLANYLELRKHPRTFVTRPFLGIAAFPSLHVAHSLFFVLSAARYHRWLLCLYLPLFVALSFSTVFWGWHWTGDLVAGALIAVFVMKLANRLVPEDECVPPVD